MLKLGFYVPKNHLDNVKQALFAVGVGKIGNYDCCCWQTLGQGEFRALEGSKPALGEQGKAEVVVEYRVEMVCDETLIKQAVLTLKHTHPYEEPAYDVIKLEDVLDYEFE